MADRFSRIKKGAYYNGALQNYIEYLQQAATRQPNVGSRGALPARQQVFVEPFGKDMGSGNVVAVFAAETSVTELADDINFAGTGARVLTTLGGNTVVAAPGFSPARVNYFRNANRSVTTPVSKFTGKEYLKYAGSRFSCPFGRNTASDDQDDAFAAVKARLMAQTGLAVKRVSLQPERWRQR